MRTITKCLGGVVAVAAATFLSGFTALAGARATGLQEGGWNWQFMPPLFFGYLGGFVISLICLAATGSLTLSYSRRLAVTFVVPLLITFGVSGIAYFIILSPEGRAAASHRQVFSDLHFKPDAVHDLIAQAGVRKLSNPERHALWQMLWVPQSIPAEDVSFLLDYFERDESALGAIMVRQSITPEQLRYLYQRHKRSSRHSRVLDELASHPLTPSDVLQSLANGDDHLVATKVRKRLAKN